MRGGVKLIMWSGARKKRPGDHSPSMDETGPSAVSDSAVRAALFATFAVTGKTGWPSWTVEGYICVSGSPGLAAVDVGVPLGCPDPAIKCTSTSVL